MFWPLNKLIQVSRRETCDRYYVLPLFGFALFVHRLHRDEDKGIYHNHPWSGLSLILGRYLEQRHGEAPKMRWGFHWLPATKHHRIELPWGPVWTIFFHLRRFHKWTVINEAGETIATEPWRAIGGVQSYNPDKNQGELR